MLAENLIMLRQVWETSQDAACKALALAADIRSTYAGQMKRLEQLAEADKDAGEVVCACYVMMCACACACGSSGGMECAWGERARLYYCVDASVRGMRACSVWLIAHKCSCVLLCVCATRVERAQLPLRPALARDDPPLQRLLSPRCPAPLQAVRVPAPPHGALPQGARKGLHGGGARRCVCVCMSACACVVCTWLVGYSAVRVWRCCLSSVCVCVSASECVCVCNLGHRASVQVLMR